MTHWQLESPLTWRHPAALEDPPFWIPLLGPKQQSTPKHEQAHSHSCKLWSARFKYCERRRVAPFELTLLLDRRRGAAPPSIGRTLTEF